jgi:hypothetical protein
MRGQGSELRGAWWAGRAGIPSTVTGVPFAPDTA